MPGPLEVRPPSVSTTGYVDGLGRRTIRFDREIGEAIECLELRPEFSAYDAALLAQSSAVGALEDERLVRVRSVERHGARVMVLSELVTGDRLSDIIEARSQGDAAISGLDAAFGFLLQILPTLARMHGARLVHGAVAPGRVILTSNARVVVADAIYGTVLPRLQLSRRHLWSELQIAAPPAAGPVRFDASADVTQASLCGLMLALGRFIDAPDPIEQLPLLVGEAVEIAQIRGGDRLAELVRRFFSATLPLAGLRTGVSADEAARDAQVIASSELGDDACVAALGDFLRYEAPTPPVPKPRPVLVKPIERPAPPPPMPAPEPEPEAVEELVPLDELEDPEVEPEPETELPPAPEPAVVSRPSVAAPPVVPVPVTPPPVVATPVVATPPISAPVGPRPVVPAPVTQPAIPPAPVTPAPVVSTPVIPAPVSPAPVIQAPAMAPPAPAPAFAAPVAAAPAPEPVTPAPLPPPPPPQPEPLIPRSVAEAFFAPTPAPVPPPAPPPAPPLMPAPPPVAAPRFQPPVAAPLPTRSAGLVPNPYATNPGLAPPSPPPPLTPPPPEPRVTPGPVTLRLKHDSGGGYGGTSPISIRPDPYGSHMPTMFGTHAAAPEPSRFPTKLAVAVLGIAVAAIIGGRAYMARDRDSATPTGTPAATTTSPPVAPPTRATSAPSGTTAVLTVASVPSGARVLLNGTHAGETPLRLEGLPPGRHTVTLVTDNGSVKRTVKLEAGKTVALDIPVFSGWVAVFAPITLDVAEGGRSIGSTEQGRIMLSPGRHVLTVSNRQLGYSSTHAIEINAGEESPLNLTPTGQVNLNAQPWAEVWVDGTKAGETPIANLEVPLGTREFVFKHPEYGERRITVTVTTTPKALTVDFTKPGTN